MRCPTLPIARSLFKGFPAAATPQLEGAETRRAGHEVYYRCPNTAVLPLGCFLEYHQPRIRDGTAITLAGVGVPC